MKTRIIVGSMIAIAIPVVFFLLPSIFMPILFALLSMVGLYEVLQAMGFVKNRWVYTLAILVAGVIPFWEFYDMDLTLGLCGIFVYFVAIFLVAMGSNYAVTIEMVGGSFFFAVLIPYFFSAFVRIGQLPLGFYYIILPFVVSAASDTFAYFVGMAIGKHKLAPQLSPKKTKEGAVGGLLGGLFWCVVYGYLMERWFGLQVNYVALALYGGIGSVISQIGDLSFSYIKRQYDLKDFGDVFPGHGGVLDRFDSVIFCAPFIEIMIYFLPAFQGG